MTFENCFRARFKRFCFVHIQHKYLYTELCVVGYLFVNELILTYKFQMFRHMDTVRGKVSLTMEKFCVV